MCGPDKYVLVENFKWLLGELARFDDPQFTYSSVGRQDLRGGERRKYRDFVDFSKYARVKNIKGDNVTFGSIVVPLDVFSVDHDHFKNPELKERYPKPKVPYTVKVTSRKSLEDGTARRYYVSCDCMDFDTTFKEELINYGYTTGTVVPGTGQKKLGPAICKHLYSGLIREYKGFISLEAGEDPSAEIEIEWPGPSGLGPVASVPPSTWHEEPESEEEPESTIPPVIQKKRGRIPKTPAEKKSEYEKIIRRSLKFFSNIMPNTVEIYKNSRQGGNSYKKYKFMIKNYVQGSVIVFTNPQLNPLRDKVKDKELVPLMNKTAKGMSPFGDSIVVYTKYFSKQELMDMIKAETREIQPNQIEKLNKTVKTYSLTESLEVNNTDYTSIRTLLLGLD